MVKPRILIVEDEWIIASDLKESLIDLGYDVPSIAATGREAIEYVKTNKIDLVLMDIVLQGGMDGIEAAREIISAFDIPVIYLTAYADEAILRQAKKSGAYGYLIKPFKDREMQAAIEMALYKHEMEKKLKESEEQHYITLRSINDAVISTDNKGLIMFMNPLAESLTGWKLEHAKKKSLSDIFDITKGGTDRDAENPVIKIIRKGLAVTQANYIMHPSKGAEMSIELSSAPMKNDKGNISGVVIVFRDVTKRIQTEKELEEYRKQLQSLTSQLPLIEENEKRRIATELHDCIGQTLALSKIKLGLLNKSAPSEELRKSIKEILQLIEQAIKETRTLTFELSPPVLYELGLSQAIKWLIDQFRDKHGLDIEFIDDGQDKPFNHNTRFFLFQAIRELLVNVVKHAQATRASIVMKRDDTDLRIILEDNGTGFSGASVNYDGYGLFNIRERMNHINGQFEIKSIPGRGTRVTLVAPLMSDKKLTERS